MGGPAARRRLGRVRPRHPDLGRLHRPRPGPGQARPELHRPGGAAADDLGRAGPPLQPARRQPGLGRAGLAGLLPRPPGRPGARPHPRRRPAQLHLHGLRRRAERPAGARHEPVLERERRRRLGRGERRRGRDRIAAEHPRRRGRVRHARHRGARRGGGGGPRVPPLREPAQGRRAGHHREVPYLVEFSGSVGGLHAGSPVQFNGIPVGVVTDVQLEYDAASTRSGSRSRSTSSRSASRSKAGRRRASPTWACATWWPRACGRSSSPATC